MSNENKSKETDAPASEWSDLLACHCGCKDIAKTQSFGGSYYYECRRCGKMSSLFGHNTLQDAKKAWNDSLKS